MNVKFRATAPGRVNLIGDHVDYMGGPVLPMAVQLSTTITGTRFGSEVSLTSDQESEPLQLQLPSAEPKDVSPVWGRYIAGIAQEMGATIGFSGTVSSTVPPGSGLSSSSALSVAAALAFGSAGSIAELAVLSRAGEVRATGVPCGIMDQLASAGGVAGHALLIDCASLAIDPVAVPPEARIWVVPSGQQRRLGDSEYSQRRAACEAASELIGPLPDASLEAIEELSDPILRRRARHVRTESERVRRAAEALRSGELAEFGQLMIQSHRSLADDFEVSTSVLDTLVNDLTSQPGVLGARLTGAGFGGCVVALAQPGVELRGWLVTPSAGADIELLA